ncbi:unnamed protein product, partial [Ixodes persulcatus]
VRRQSWRRPNRWSEALRFRPLSSRGPAQSAGAVSKPERDEAEREEDDNVGEKGAKIARDQTGVSGPKKVPICAGAGHAPGHFRDARTCTPRDSSRVSSRRLSITPHFAITLETRERETSLSRPLP